MFFFPVREVGNPIVLSTLIAQCVNAKEDSAHPVRVLVLWDFPASVTLKCLPSRET